jgi:hypothetical protein
VIVSLFIFVFLLAFAAVFTTAAVRAGPVDIVQALWTDSPVAPL